MDDLTRERYGPLPVREKPRAPESEEDIRQRRIELCGTADLHVMDFPITFGRVVEERLQRAIRGVA
jgi:hypothetical protein